MRRGPDVFMARTEETDVGKAMHARQIIDHASDGSPPARATATPLGPSVTLQAGLYSAATMALSTDGGDHQMPPDPAPEGSRHGLWDPKGEVPEPVGERIFRLDVDAGELPK